ncbi:MAG: hypothetical protein AB2L24_22815 [Mangrovibacterium sp.]
MNNHKLYLGMYSFQIKKSRSSNEDIVAINDFLSESYPDARNKFAEGFSQEIISLFDEKAFKNKNNTHGGTLDEKTIASDKRYLDILIDGGITGIEQFLVDENGNKEKISRDKIVGLKFFARFWLPAGSKTGYIVIQKYGGLSLKPLFDEIIKSTLRNHGYIIATPGKNIRAITTKKRLKHFLRSSALRDVTVISKNSSHDTGAGDAQTVTIKLKNIVVNREDKKIDKKVVADALKNHGFKIGNRNYEMTATYESKFDGKKDEEKTTKLDVSEDSINIIPNIILPSKCVDSDGYPNFRETRLFVDEEIDQIRKEANL